MKTLCVTLGLGAVLLAVTSANAAIVTIGNSMARSCFEAAEARAPNLNNFTACDRALSEEALDRRDRAATLVNRGILRLVGRSYAQAGRDFDEAITVNPVEPEAFLNKAILQVQTGASSAAFASVDRALELNTQRPALAYFVRGLANEETGNIKAAYADLKRASDLDPDWAAPTLELRRYKVR